MRAILQNLQPKHEKAIAALLAKRTIAEAAETAGVGESTLLRWLKEESFAATYRDARREAVGLAITQLQQASQEAVLVLRVIARDALAPASARVTAARAILDLAMRGVEIDDLAARMGVLEQQLSALMEELK